MRSALGIRPLTTAAVILVFLASVAPNCWSVSIDGRSIVGPGWHPWYEIKVDPEDQNKMIICGTKWDAVQNSLLGVVYASSDAGVTWHTALEDRSSLWVTEHSCAFGRDHRAYFVSEASKVVDGQLHHELGTTRLFVS